MLKVELMTRRTPQIPQSVEYHGHIRSLSRYVPAYPVTPQWAAGELSNRVRLGTGAERLDVLYPPMRYVPTITIPEPDTRTSCETEPIDPDRKFYSSVLRKKYPLLTDRFNTIEQAIALILHPTFRAGPLENISEEYISQLIKNVQWAWEDRQLPLEFIIPTLPFKDQSPVTTHASIDHVGLGEHLMLARWAKLTKSIDAVAGKNRAVVRIISDGSVYADLFAGGNTSEVKSYSQKCHDMIQNCGWDKHMTITDMKEIIALDSRFHDVRQTVDHQLRVSYGSHHEDSVHIDSLTRGMMFNMKLPEPFNEYDAFTYLAGLPMEQINADHPEIYQRITDAAYGYSSFLLTMQYLHILRRAYPEPSQIRSTVHPKPGQLGLRTGDSSVAPYNGVSVVNNDGLVKNIRFFRALEYDALSAVHIGSDPNAYYYITNASEPG